MNLPKAIIVLICTTGTISFCSCAAWADAISPNIHETDKVYSKEKPNAAYFGSGIAGRLTEASRLRFEGEHYTIEGEFDKAIEVLRKAVQLDEGDPQGHVLLARAMTKAIRRSNANEPDKKLISQCIQEWSLIDKHDADHTHQFEARKNLRALKALSKGIYLSEHPEEKKKRDKSFFVKTSNWLKKSLKREEKEDEFEFPL